jgi:uncharacterized protein (TIGR00288 family)
MAKDDTNATMAVFFDLENIVIGVRRANYPRFNIRKVIDRLLTKGHIVVKKAYCDWDRYKEFKRPLHETAFELIEVPTLSQSGKNSADIRMVVDALDLCYTKQHVDSFVILSGDSDFSPLVSKLRENAKKVIGIGVKSSSSDLFISNCDEFIYYDDLVREEEEEQQQPTTAPVVTEAKEPSKPEPRARRSRSTSVRPERADRPERVERTRPERIERPERAERAESTEAAEPRQRATAPKRLDPAAAFALLKDVVEALAEERGDKPINLSRAKDAVKRRDPGFNEKAFGFKTFGMLAQAAQKAGCVKVEPSDRGDGTLWVRPWDRDTDS